MISTLSTDMVANPEHQPDLSEVDYHILVVDDESSLREFLAAALGGAGYVVDTAADAAEALEKLHRRHFDLLLTDFNMPRKNGLDLIRHMRADGCEIPAILMSGRTTGLLTEHPGVHVSGVLTKPFMLSELLDVTAHALRSAGHTGTPPSAANFTLDPLPHRRRNAS